MVLCAAVSRAPWPFLCALARVGGRCPRWASPSHLTPGSCSPVQGDHVWYDNTTGGEFDLMIGAIVKAADAGQVQLVLATGEECWVPQEDNAKIKTMHPSSISGVDDMASRWPRPALR